MAEIDEIIKFNKEELVRVLVIERESSGEIAITLQVPLLCTFRNKIKNAEYYQLSVKINPHKHEFCLYDLIYYFTKDLNMLWAVAQ